MLTEPSKFRVRTGKGYASGFNTVLGQRNVSLVSRRLPPFHRLWAGAEAFCILEPGYQLVHTINSIPIFPRCPFVISFEDYLPRIWPNSRLAFRLRDYLRDCLISDRCIRLIAFSQYAIRQFRDQNNEYSGLKTLEGKLEVLYPSVPLRRTVHKQLGKKLRILSVGKDFMHKGIPAVVRAHRILRSKGINVDTHIVSSLRWVPDDNIGPPSRVIVEQEKMRLLTEDGISFHGKLSNEQVLNLMEQCDFFVLPTFHDTFGYVSIEAMSCGTPVIASDTSAQSEIIADGVCGYLLPIENEKRVGYWVWIDRRRDSDYIDAYMQQLNTFAYSLAERLEILVENGKEYERLSSGAIERVRSLFDRDKARNRLEKIYMEAFVR